MEILFYLIIYLLLTSFVTFVWLCDDAGEKVCLPQCNSIGWSGKAHRLFQYSG